MPSVTYVNAAPGPGATLPVRTDYPGPKRRATPGTGHQARGNGLSLAHRPDTADRKIELPCLERNISIW